MFQIKDTAPVHEKYQMELERKCLFATLGCQVWYILSDPVECGDINNDKGWHIYYCFRIYLATEWTLIFNQSINQ